MTEKELLKEILWELKAIFVVLAIIAGFTISRVIF
jgi:hypothetical protein